MDRYSKRLVIVITAAIAAQANTRTRGVDEGGDTFTVALSVSGSLPATHYWCSWQMTDNIDVDVRRVLQTLIDSGEARVFNGNQRSRAWVLGNIGLKRINT